MLMEARKDSRDCFCLTATGSPFQSNYAISKKENLSLILVEMPMNLSGFQCPVHFVGRRRLLVGIAARL